MNSINEVDLSENSDDSSWRGKDEPTLDALGYGDKPVRDNSEQVDIRHGKRTSVVEIPADMSTRIFDFDSSYDFDDSSVDYTDTSEEEIEVDMEEENDSPRAFRCVCVDYDDDQTLEKSAHLPTQLTMEFDKDATTPKRMSLHFTQRSSGQSTTRDCPRSGCLGVSLGTSRLPRRRTTMNHTMRLAAFRDGPRRINSSASTGSVRRITMGHSQPPTGDRGGSNTLIGRTSSGMATPRSTHGITRNLASRPSRRSTLDHSEVQPTIGCSISGMAAPRSTRGITRNTSSRPSRRTTIDHSVQPTRGVHSSQRTSEASCRPGRRVTMDFAQPSATKVERKVSMNMTKSHLSRAIPKTRRCLSPASRCA